jgi:diaminohydroxyphosphoribosylaminopyrimidine deaminase/5-amino-6-(5-phosphoribosylamino)uracil reductase
MTDATDAALMARALRLAARGLYTVDGNPRVGCVLAHGETVVGEGYHAAAGEAHAERVALVNAGAQAHGATAYVTLEPCCHHGRTPPCTQALVAAGVARVVYALRDPDPRVAGSGVAELEAAGVRVERRSAAAPQARLLNIGYVKRLATGRPWIRVKMAASLDGRSALASGESQWITGSPARTDGHRWRARSSLVLTGRATIADDDPSLNARVDAAALGLDRPTHQPGVAIVDRELRTPPHARVLDAHERVVIFCDASAPRAWADALRTRGAEIAVVAADAHGLEPGAVFAALGERGANEVHVEAGQTLSGRLLATGYVDELILYMAPTLLGEGARGLFDMGPLASLSERVDLHIRDVRAIGGDLRVQALPIIDRE